MALVSLNLELYANMTMTDNAKGVLILQQPVMVSYSKEGSRLQACAKAAVLSQQTQTTVL